MTENENLILLNQEILKHREQVLASVVLLPICMHRDCTSDNQHQTKQFICTWQMLWSVYQTWKESFLFHTATRELLIEADFPNDALLLKSEL